MTWLLWLNEGNWIWARATEEVSEHKVSYLGSSCGPVKLWPHYCHLASPMSIREIRFEPGSEGSQTRLQPVYSLLQKQPLFVTTTMPRLLEQTKNVDWEGSECEKRPRLIAMQRPSSIATASAQPMFFSPMWKPSDHFQIAHLSAITTPIPKEVLASPHHRRSMTWGKANGIWLADSGLKNGPRRGLLSREGELIVLHVPIWKGMEKCHCAP